jgi:hypothetical protein
MLKTAERERGFVFALVMVAFIALALAATGCKKDDDDPIIIIQPDVGGTMYYAATNYGDLVKFQLNTTTEEYSFLQLEGTSPIGVGQGGLIHQAGLGTYAYKDADPAEGKMYAAIPDKLVALGGDGLLSAALPVISTSYVVASVTGMYNYISFQDDDLDDVFDAEYGTLLIENGTWKVYETVDGTAFPASNVAQGTWTDNGNGIISIYTEGIPGKFGSVIVHPSANGKILVMNMLQFYGILLGLEQQATTSGDFDGTYDSIDNDQTDFGEVTFTGTTLDFPDPDPDVVLTFNSPWTGFATDAGGTLFGLASQDGFIMSVTISAVSAHSIGIGIMR